MGLLGQALRTGREIKDPRIEGFAAAQLERLRLSGPGGKTEDAGRPPGNRSRGEWERRTESIQTRRYFQGASSDPIAPGTLGRGGRDVADRNPAGGKPVQ